MSDDVVINFGRRKTDHEPGDCAGGCADITAVVQRLQLQDKDIKEIHEEVKNIYTEIKANNADTSEILELVQKLKGFIGISGYMGKFAAWILALAAPVIAIIVTIKFGGKQ